MRRLLMIVCIVCVGIVRGNAQPPAVPGAPDEVHFLRHLLLILGSYDARPQVVKAREEALTIQFGLTANEVATIDAAAKQYGVILLQIKQFIANSPSDKVGLAQLIASRTQAENALANQILSSVRPETARHLQFASSPSTH